MTGTLSWFIRMSTDTETQMNSVERILYYGNLESESAYDVPGKIDIDMDVKEES